MWFKFTHLASRISAEEISVGICITGWRVYAEVLHYTLTSRMHAAVGIRTDTVHSLGLRARGTDSAEEYEKTLGTVCVIRRGVSDC